MAQGLLQHRLDELGFEARVHSAGRLYDDAEVSSGSVAALRARGLDISSHRSRTTTREMLRDADLVLAMERAHVREAVVLERSVWPRAFTLKELVRRGGQLGPRKPDEELVDWLARVHAGRSSQDLLGSGSDDDVADPIGGPDELYARTADEIDTLLRRVVDLAFAPAAPAARRP